MKPDQTRTGTVKFYKSHEGYGFLTDDADKADWFFHHGELPLGAAPQKGDRVTFKPGISRGRPCATSVRLI